MKYRKKPIVIEALKFQAEYGIARVANWLAQQGADIKGWTFHDNEITILTPEGKMKATDGDFIIRGVAGEFYPCKEEIFDQTYEEVDVGEKEIETISIQRELEKAAEELPDFNNGITQPFPFMAQEEKRHVLYDVMDAAT